jgi:hypothetical protein
MNAVLFIVAGVAAVSVVAIVITYAIGALDE